MTDTDTRTAGGTLTDRVTTAYRPSSLVPRGSGRPEWLPDTRVRAARRSWEVPGTAHRPRRSARP